MDYKDVTKEEMDGNMLQEPVAGANYSAIKNVQSMPCSYTDEEFEQILQEAEKGPYVSDEVVRKMFAAWL